MATRPSAEWAARRTSPARYVTIMAEWPADWGAVRQGKGCPFCAEGRPDENLYGVRIYAGQVLDAHLQRRGTRPRVGCIAPVVLAGEG